MKQIAKLRYGKYDFMGPLIIYIDESEWHQRYAVSWDLNKLTYRISSRFWELYHYNLCNYETAAFIFNPISKHNQYYTQ